MLGHVCSLSKSVGIWTQTWGPLFSIARQTQLCSVVWNRKKSPDSLFEKQVQNFWAQSIVPKFPGRGSKISPCRIRTVSFHSTRKTSFTLIKEEDVGSLLPARARWRFRPWYQWYCVSCFIHSNLTSITGYFKQTVPRYLPYDFKHHVRIKWRKEHSKFSREKNRL